jgi:hypothetical protein
MVKSLVVHVLTYQAMQTYSRVAIQQYSHTAIQPHAFLVSAFDRGGLLASRSGDFTSGERSPGFHCIEGCVSHRAVLDMELEGSKEDSFLFICFLKSNVLNRS